MIYKDVGITDIWNMVDLMRIVINNNDYTPTPDVTCMLCEIILSIAESKPAIEHTTIELQNILDYIREYNSNKTITKKAETIYEIKRRIVIAIADYLNGIVSEEQLSYAAESADIDDLL